MENETREAAPSHLLLKIESFSLLDKCEVEKYESQEFDAGNYKWRLIIYPKGQGTERRGDNISVHLAISGTDDDLPDQNWEVNAVFSIFILNQISGNYHHITGNTRRFFRLKTEWGVPNFMSKKYLMNPSNGYLIDDCCVFGAEVFIIDNSEAGTQCLSLKDVQVPCKHEIKISDFSTLKEQKVWFSEEFIAGGYKWKIVLYPNGISEESGRNMSVYLVYATSNDKKSDERVKLRFTICMKNQLDPDKNCNFTCSDWFGVSGNGWGCPKFILLDELNDACGGFIAEDTCLFEIQISVVAVSK